MIDSDSLIKIASFIFIQTIIFSYYVGKITSKINTNKKEIDRFSVFHRKEIESIKKDLSASCKTQLESNQKVLNLKLEQNSIEHTRLFNIVDKISGDLEILLRK